MWSFDSMRNREIMLKMWKQNNTVCDDMLIDASVIRDLLQSRFDVRRGKGCILSCDEINNLLEELCLNNYM